MSPARIAVVVFVRAPRLGTVKTRVAATLGDARALEIYRALVERTMIAATGSGLPVTVAFTPDDAEREVRDWLGAGASYRAQAPGDLGERMAASVADTLDAGARGALVIGSDCPELTPATLRAAAARLEEADVVFGPAADGGYYLVGMRDTHRELFHEVPWSSSETLEVSLHRARTAGLRVALLEVLRDIDTGDDLAAWEATA